MYGLVAKRTRKRLHERTSFGYLGRAESFRRTLQLQLNARQRKAKVFARRNKVAVNIQNENKKLRLWIYSVVAFFIETNITLATCRPFMQCFA